MSTDDDTEAEARATARALFTDDDTPETDDDTEPQHGNVAPREGTIPTARPDERRAAVRAIFGDDPA